MKSFRNDYCLPAHPRIIEALSKNCLEVNEAYGGDKHSLNAAKMIGKRFGCPGAPVYFLAGGTQTNMAVISFCLKPYEAVIAVDSGHINVHETGAVEGSGHKILLAKGKEGKITREGIEEVLKLHGDNRHMVKPAMVYISNSTELGTIYTYAELEDISKVCHENGLILFLDGARIGAAIMAEENDLTPEDLGRFCDVFYIGGTKNGLLFGEALVFANKRLAEGFDYHVKNKGALLAKGFVLGIMFEEAFKDGLYFALAEKTNATAKRLALGLGQLGYDPLPSPTNQIFVSFPRELANKCIQRYGCELWEDKGEQIMIRFVTNFTTEDEDVDEALSYLDNQKK